MITTMLRWFDFREKEGEGWEGGREGGEQEREKFVEIHIKSFNILDKKIGLYFIGLESIFLSCFYLF